MGTMDEALSFLISKESFLVLSHASPDGDTLGSATALMRALVKKGKKVKFMCADRIPPKYDYLFEGIEYFEGDCEAIVSVDVADPELLGSLQKRYGEKVDLAIDHHGTHAPFGKIEWVDPTAAANAEMVYLLIKEMGFTPDKAMADCIYTGISTDTGCFKYINATSRSYRIAADVIDCGASAAAINRVMFDTKTRACAEVERVVMRDMEFYYSDKIALVSLPKKLVEEAGADEGDLEGIPAIPRRIEGVLIGITVKEKDAGIWKASVRAFPPVDASYICRQFGGGGHKGAAGCTLGNDYEAAKKKLVAECTKHLEELGL